MGGFAFKVLGIAVPFVRVSPGKNGGVYEDRAYAHWKSQVIDAARDAIQRQEWKTATTAVRVSMEFVLVRRPTKKPAKKLLPHPTAGKSVGDLDSYIRPVGDGMTRAGVVKDDMLIVEFAETRKRWQQPNEEFAGVVVRVELL